jgi:hypothetical protein
MRASQYKQYVAPAGVSRFDSVITELHRWEDVRYGGFPNAPASVAKSVGMVRVPVRTSKAHPACWDCPTPTVGDS